jgi:hypothetical protein
LRNAVYSSEKAIDLKNTLEVLGENWFLLKEKLKSLKLEKVPQIDNKKLVKP